ncbi:glycosyltransferase family 61 protein [Acetobacter musti]|nr:glycosyltransferase family 61 protein [Acetobacter musti]
MSQAQNDILALNGAISAFDEPDRQPVCYTASVRYPMPVPAFDDQSTESFERGLALYEAEADAAARSVKMPAVTLSLFTLENARFVIDPDAYGMILDADSRIVFEPSCFSSTDLLSGTAKHLPDMPVRDELDEVFIGFDAAWTHYYHWLLYGISKTSIADSILPKSVDLVIPDFSVIDPDTQRPSFTSETFEASLDLAGLKNRVRRTGNGIWRAKKLHFLWHAPQMPELYVSFARPCRVFDGMDIQYRPDLPKRFYITREGSSDPRITPEEQAEIERVLKDEELEKVFPEKLDFETQAALFRQAEFIMAPHGAGLANLIFAKPGTMVLELNRQIDQPHLRNCFYLVALQRQLYYSFLDLSTEKLTAPLLEGAIARLYEARLRQWPK